MGFLGVYCFHIPFLFSELDVGLETAASLGFVRQPIIDVVIGLLRLWHLLLIS